MKAENLTLQEAAEKAGFEDFMLTPGGGITSWDGSRYLGVEYSESMVRRMAQEVIDHARA